MLLKFTNVGANKINTKKIKFIDNEIPLKKILLFSIYFSIIAKDKIASIIE